MGMAKLAANNKLKSNTPADMEDGELAVIVGTDANYLGRIVQRIGNSLYTIGGRKENKWGDIWGDVSVLAMQVRILQPGELIEVT